MENNQSPQGEKEVLNYMINELKQNETPFHKELKKKAEFILKYNQNKINWLREFDMMSIYSTFTSDILDFCRNKCVYSIDKEIEEKKCLKNCSYKYLEQIKMIELNKDYYEQEVDMSGIWFYIPEHTVPMNDVRKKLNLEGSII